jgi:glucan phosphorylase
MAIVAWFRVEQQRRDRFAVVCAAVKRSCPNVIDRTFLARTHIAYFTMEMAIRPEMQTYAGGLGVLAGDTARSCADLELPVVFVTLLSRAGYFRQEIDANGR